MIVSLLSVSDILSQITDGCLHASSDDSGGNVHVPHIKLLMKYLLVLQALNTPLKPFPASPSAGVWHLSSEKSQFFPFGAVALE